MPLRTLYQVRRCTMHDHDRCGHEKTDSTYHYNNAHMVHWAVLKLGCVDSHMLGLIYCDHSHRDAV